MCQRRKRQKGQTWVSYADVQLAEEAVAVLGRALKVVAREELVDGEREADICRLGQVEGSESQLWRRSAHAQDVVKRMI